MLGEKSSFGNFLKQLRKQYGYKTQKQLSDATGVSQTTLSRIEAGIQNPLPETLKLLAPHLRPYTYGELMEKAGYFEGMPAGDKNTVTSFFDDHEEIDGKIAKYISKMSTQNRFHTDVLRYMEMELSPILEAEGINFEYTPSDLKQLIQEIDGEIDFKNSILQALIRIDKIKENEEFDPNFTIAAHHDGDIWTEEEIDEIKRFMEFVKSKRQNN